MVLSECLASHCLGILWTFFVVAASMVTAVGGNLTGPRVLDLFATTCLVDLDVVGRIYSYASLGNIVVLLDRRIYSETAATLVLSLVFTSDDVMVYFQIYL